MNGDNELGKRKLAPPEGRASARPVSRRYRRHPFHLPPLQRQNLPVIIFVTVGTALRRKIMASAHAHEAILSAWHCATRWIVGRYVIMPDHIHFFSAPNEFHSSSMEKWMRYWKSSATQFLIEVSGNVWQRHYWDRQLRSGESYDEKWEYVRGNPVRHRLVSEAEAWPYQGVLNELRSSRLETACG